MGVLEERKALDRAAQAWRRLIVGAREATTPTPPPELEEAPPAPPETPPAAPGRPSGE